MYVELLSSVLSSLKQGILVTSAQRKVLFANPLFCDLVFPGLQPEALEGQSGVDILYRLKDSFLASDPFAERVEEILAQAQPVIGEIVRMRDGRLLMRDYLPIREGDRMVANVWAYREVLLQLATDELAVQRILNQFVSTLYEQETEEDILWDVSRNCIAYLGFQECVVYILDEGKGLLRQQAAWGPKAPGGNVIENCLELPVGKGIVGAVALTGKPEIIDDVSQDPRYVPDDMYRQSEITVPIFSKGKVIGVIDSEHTEKGFFNERHLSVLTTLAGIVGIKITQIRERVTRQMEIEKQRQFYEQILNQVPADIAVFDKDHRYLFVNPQGIKNPELRQWIVGKTDEEYCDYRQRPYSIFKDRRAAFNRAVETQKQSEWEEALKTPAETLEYHYRKMYPVIDEAGNVELVIGYGMNVTPIKEAQAILERARKEAEENVKAKEDFLARVSHELRTPMNGILGLADLLQRTTLDGKQTQYTQLLRQSAQSLVTIVNEVLDIEKIGSGKMELHPVVFDLRDRMQALLDVHTEQAQAKGLGLRLTLGAGLAEYYRGDFNRIQQILGNLLSNALKFTDNGSIDLTVEGIDRNMLCFRVRDTGIGIESESLERIFEPFVQARAGSKLNRPGTGLGLTICKELAELMGGRMEVKSELGLGSVFSLCIPVEVVIDPVAEAQAPADGASTNWVRGKRVLLVEDVPLNRFLVEEMTKDWGLLLEMAVDGAEGVQKARHRRYDLILMDIQMPVMDGVQATEAIRKLPDPDLARVPIVALSANAFDSDRRTYLQIGMNDTLSKPFDAEQLREMMLRVLLPGEAPATTVESTETTRKGELVIDLSYLNRVGNGNSGFVQTMLRSFVESVEETTGEMETYIRRGDRKAIGEAAHKLKFALGVVGVTALKETVVFLEEQGKGVGERASEEDYALVVSHFIDSMTFLSGEARRVEEMGLRG